MNDIFQIITLTTFDKELQQFLKATEVLSRHVFGYISNTNTVCKTGSEIWPKHTIFNRFTFCARLKMLYVNVHRSRKFLFFWFSVRFTKKEWLHLPMASFLALLLDLMMFVFTALDLSGFFWLFCLLLVLNPKALPLQRCQFRHLRTCAQKHAANRVPKMTRVKSLIRFITRN